MTYPGRLRYRYRPAQGAGLGMVLLAAETPPAVVPGANRLIAGQVVPWDTPGRPTGYPGLVRFTRGSIDLGSLAGSPLLLDHDPRRPIGRMRGMIDDAPDLRASFHIAPTPSGDEALTLISAGVRDGLSIGAVVDDYDLGDPGPDGTPELIVTGAHVRETSLLTFPAYTSARAGLIPQTEGKPDGA